MKLEDAPSLGPRSLGPGLCPVVKCPKLFAGLSPPPPRAQLPPRLRDRSWAQPEGAGSLRPLYEQTALRVPAPARRFRQPPVDAPITSKLRTLRSNFLCILMRPSSCASASQAPCVPAPVICSAERRNFLAGPWWEVEKQCQLLLLLIRAGLSPVNH